MADPKALVKRLDAWLSTHGRQLPWRVRHEPYEVLLAEFILQQTRMETGLRYFEKLMRRFPTLRSLAEASLEDVLSAWSGLGYYSRARNLHAAANTILSRHGGRVPDEREALLALPGIGPYTAGAILSIAFDQPEPSLDGNQYRVLGRLLGTQATDAASRRRIESFARGLLTTGSPRRTNQALMDLGSLVCTPEAPKCGACPLASACPSRDTPGSVRTKAQAAPVDHVVARLHHEGGRVWLRRPSASGLLAGLWLPPLRKGTHGERWHLEHVFSHRRWRIRIVRPRTRPSGEGRWVTPAELEALPHSALTVRLIRAALGDEPLVTVGETRSPAAKVRFK